MPTKLNQKQRDHMFKAWQEKQSMQYVKRACNFSHSTVRRYRDLDHWDERLVEIQREAHALSDTTDAGRLALLQANLADVRSLIVDRLTKLLKEGKLDLGITDLDRIIRLEQYIHGLPDSHTELTLDPIAALIASIQSYDATHPYPPPPET